MKNKLFFFVILSLLIIGHTIRSEASDIDSQLRITKQIWALEERYITSYRNANFEDLKVIWHDKFLGWPADLKRPANKKAVIKYLKHTESISKACPDRNEIIVNVLDD